MNPVELNRKLMLFPSLMKQKESSLFLDERDFPKHEDSEFVEIGKPPKKISAKLLADLLNDDYCFASIERLFTGTKVRMPIYYIGTSKGIAGKFIFSRREFIAFFNKAIDEGKIELSEQGKERLEFIKNEVSYDTFVKKYGEKTYRTDIEGKMKSFKVKDFITLMNLPKEQFERFFSNDDFINGVTKREYAFALADFCSDIKVFDIYMMPREMNKRYDELCSYDVIDYESVNSMLDSDAYLYKDIVLQEELRNHLYEGMPENLSDIEKAIYVYIKACKLFSYDPLFYSNLQKGVAALKHQDINNLTKINVDNKDIVCYEFTAIYGKILEELGINFEIDSEAISSEYGAGHNRLAFRQGKYIVEADSVTTIFQGDLVRAKTNYPLEGIKCLNASAKTKNEFRRKVSKISAMMAADEMEFNDAINKYENLMIDREKIPFEEKVELYLEKISGCGKKLGGIDGLGYAFLLSKTIFSKEERTSNINFGVFKIGKGTREDIKLVISINKKGFNNSKDNRYLIYHLDGTLVEIEKEELRKWLKGKDCNAIDKDKAKVPGMEG